MTHQANFNIGDVVRLKSGGPDMTVQALPNTTRRAFRCQWFAGKKLEGGFFATETLEAVGTED